jgi:hypothetical protein
LLSDFIEPSFFSLWFPELLIRKKFFSFCGKGEWPLACLPLFDDIETPDKFRFSLLEDGKGFGVDEWNNCVIEVVVDSFDESCNSKVEIGFDVEVDVEVVVRVENRRRSEHRRREGKAKV